MKLILAVILTITTHQAWSVEVQKIELFLNSNMPIQNQLFARDIQLKIIYVDDVERLESHVSQQLPNDPQKARIIAKELTQNTEFTQALSQAYQGQLKAWRYGIKHLPAAVINNGQGLIYGSSDIAELLSQAEQQ